MDFFSVVLGCFYKVSALSVMWQKVRLVSIFPQIIIVLVRHYLKQLYQSLSISLSLQGV